MQNAAALLGKSGTDDWPISLTSLVYAVYVKIKKPVIADFDRSLATWWDSAVAGNSCLREGIRRRFVSEVACLNGKHCVDTFSDLEKFYTHSASAPAQMESCCVVHVPVGAHGTARVEDWRPVEWISPCNSIPASLFRLAPSFKHFTGLLRRHACWTGGF